MTQKSRRRWLSDRPVEHLEPRRLLAGQLFLNEQIVPADTPNGVLTADFNGDGNLDVAMTRLSFADDAVSIAFGDGVGGFTAVITVPVAAARGVAAADFNGDGSIDLAVPNLSRRDEGQISVLVNNGSGVFSTLTNLPLANNEGSIRAADFNGDGAVDLAIIGTYAVSLLTGRGNGAFDEGPTTPVPVYPGATAVGDFNGDGRADLVVSSVTAASVSIFTGNANGTFAPASAVMSGVVAASLNVADVNTDGRPDLVTTVAESNNVIVQPGLGNGRFGAAAGYAVGARPGSTTAADLDGDGDIDLATADYNRGTLIVLRGDGAGHFTAGPAVPVVPILGLVTSADLNTDGNADLIAVSSIHGPVPRVAVLLNPGDGVFRTPPTVRVGLRPVAVAIADFDADGRPDVVTADYGASRLSLLRGRGGGTFAPAVTLPSDGTQYEPTAVATADFNGDNRPDVVSANSASGSVSVYPNTGDGTFAAQRNTFVAAGTRSLVVADFNADGRPDIAAASPGTNTVSVLLGRGDGTFAAAGTIPTGSGPNALTAGDFNGDGHPDIAVATQVGTLLVLLGDDGKFTPAAPVAIGASPSGIVVGDFNRDGRLDLATVTSASATVSVRLGNGDGSFVAGADVRAGEAARSIIAADLDNDGNLDLAVANAGGAGTVAVVRGVGDGTFQRTTRLPVGSTPYAAAAGDFNGDGRLDLAAANYLDSTVSVLTNTGVDDPAVPGVTAVGGVLTLAGRGPVMIGGTGGVLNISTPAGTRRLVSTALASFILSAEDLTLTKDLGRGGSARNNVFVAAGTTTTLKASQHLTALSVAGQVRLPAGGTRVVRVNDLNMDAMGTLDLNDNALVYDYSGSVRQAGVVRNLIASGRSNGTWTGPGLTSTAARTAAGGRTTLAYLEALEYQSAYGSTATFAGETVDATAVLVRYTLYGDTDLDGGVSMVDFNRLSAHFGTTEQTGFGGDFDDDGGVSIHDFNLLAANFGQTLTTAPLPRAAVAPAKGARRSA